MSPEFVPALELNAGFYRDVVEPIVRPWRHSAALLGRGSELLGFDTERSTDHGWGPRLQVFVAEGNAARVRTALTRQLPTQYRGWPVAFGWDDVPVSHHVTVVPLGEWLATHLGCNPLESMSRLDWLTTPQQLLLGVVRGAVYHDATGELAEVRERLRFFPPDLAVWLLACQWRRVWQQEALVGRTAEVDDDAGSRLVAGSIVRDLMRMHFLLAGEYWPYAKWFGTAYRALPGAAETGPLLEAVLDASGFSRREDALVAAYETFARLHNAAGLTEMVEPTVGLFHQRPFRVLHSDRFVAACLARVRDDWLRSRPLLGSIDQVVDSTDVLAYPELARSLRALYGAAS